MKKKEKELYNITISEQFKELYNDLYNEILFSITSLNIL
jgi:hypothetical protein